MKALIFILLLTNWSFSQNKVFITCNYNDFYIVDIETCSYQFIGTNPTDFYDVAYNPVNGIIYGITTNGVICTINQNTGQSVPLCTTDYFNGLACSASGVMYAIKNNGDLFSINVVNGSVYWLGNTGLGYNSAGDLTFYDGYLYYSGMKYNPPYSPTGGLIKIDLNDVSNSTVTPLYNYTFGLATLGCEAEIYSFNSNNIYRLDKTNSFQPVFHCSIPISSGVQGATQMIEPKIYGEYEIGADTTIFCDSTTGIIDAEIQGATYTWNTGSTAPFIVIDQEGSYSVQTNHGICEYSDTIEVLFKQNPVFDYIHDTTLCEGNYFNLEYANDTYNYTWQNQSSENTFLVSNEGIYWVDINNQGCILRDTINVAYTNFSVSNLPSDTLLCFEDTLILNVYTPGASYNWSDGSFDSIRIITSDGSYQIVTDYLGCTWEDEIDVAFHDCEIAIEMPNVFTPNIDGVNDLFTPIYLNALTNPKITITNRWGQVLFESSDPTKGWDGRYNNDDCVSGTYFWIIEYLDLEGAKKSSHGFFQLVR